MKIQMELVGQNDSQGTQYFVPVLKNVFESDFPHRLMLEGDLQGGGLSFPQQVEGPSEIMGVQLVDSDDYLSCLLHAILQQLHIGRV